MDTSIGARLQTALGDRYRLNRELGAGGMGLVYLADDLRHRRRVAVKVLRPEIAAAIGPARFLREIRIAATLQHPHILTLIDSGDADGLLYYVMPYVDGPTLRVRIARDGELPIGDAVRILRELADALAYAHAQGVVHRDVKPENVLFAAGHAELADFGIAKAVEIEATPDAETLAGAVTSGIALGSPAYMAPEQITGDRAVDHRADIYALGVLGYEALTGHHPFAADNTAAIMAAHLTREPEPLAQVRAGLPVELADVVMRCLRKRPADRWQSATELLQHLDAAVMGAGGTGALAPSREIVHARFRLTEAVCRQLSRAAFDPRMIGDEIEYLDNGLSSDVLVCFLHAFGLDGSDFEPHLRSTRYRAIAPTLYGFEPARRRRFVLPLADHFVLLTALLNDVADRIGPRMVVLAGFSSGADLALRMAGQPGLRARIDGVLALGANLSRDTCFLTRSVARLESGKESELLADLRGVGNSSVDLSTWLDIHAYLGRMLRKFQLQVQPLREHAREIIQPFEDHEDQPFARWYRDATAAGRSLRCVFEESDACTRVLREIQLRQADEGILGPHYREGSILIEPETTHFDLLKPEIVARHLEALTTTA